MSFQFPRSDFSLKYHDPNPPRTMPVIHESILSIPSRRCCTISIDDGENVTIAGTQVLSDTGEDICADNIHYMEHVLDLEAIKLRGLPMSYWSLVDSTLGKITPKQYKEHISEIIIEWTI